MSNTISKPLRADTAMLLLAESAYIGRDYGHALRSKSDMTESEFTSLTVNEPTIIRVLHKKVSRMLDKSGEAMSAADVNAFYKAAVASFKRRMTGEE